MEMEFRDDHKKNCHESTELLSGGSKISHRGGPISEGCANFLFSKLFAENGMKIIEIGLKGTLGTRAPLDPSLYILVSDGSRISQRDANPKIEMQTYFWPFLPENCRKLKKNCISLLDPPLLVNLI